MADVGYLVCRRLGADHHRRRGWARAGLRGCPSSGAVTRLTDDDYTYSDVRTAPEGVVYAMRSSYALPPHPVRIDPDGAVTALSCAERPELPGTLTEVSRRC